ncbi:MAG: hypothetical protein FJ009_21185 [Chloroflexi bacterium]|nr:hypothetical protein [Chloroflexota bacterium]
MILIFSALVLSGCVPRSPAEPIAAPSATPQAARAILFVGHRGAAGEAPENTLAAFQRGLEVGVDVIELDVHLSRDDQLVVIHDPRLDRTTDGSGLVRDFPLADLRRVNAAARFKGASDFGAQPYLLNNLG